MLTYSDPLPHPPRRVLVAGVTGVGKTTLARRLAQLWGLPRTELDALNHGPNWTVLPTFDAEVADMARQDRWITEWAYWGRGTRALLGGRADTLVWLNFPRPLAWQRLLRRTLRRRLLRERLWHGNVEPGLHTFFTRPGDNILRWEMRTHDKWRQRMPAVIADFPQLQVVELRTPAQVRRWLAGPAAAGRNRGSGR